MEITGLFTFFGYCIGYLFSQLDTVMLSSNISLLRVLITFVIVDLFANFICRILHTEQNYSVSNYVIHRRNTEV